MNKASTNYFVIFFIILMAIPYAYFISNNSISFYGVPVIYICFIFAFIINWLAFIPAFLFKTEYFFDLFGSITFISIVLFALYSKALSGLVSLDYRSIMLASLVVIWAIRLGTFLFMRVIRNGHDIRFNEIKKSFPWFLMVWTLQAFWVSVTSSCAIVSITSLSSINLNIYSYLGLFLWLFGFLFQIIADNQKVKFKSITENKNKFINVGLWSISRHPNYFGEIVLWFSIAAISFPTFSRGNYLSLISPIFVYLLLTKVSGIPMLETKANAKWGNDESYIQYKRTTPRLFPKLF